jgi:hypothetical protein
VNIHRLLTIIALLLPLSLAAIQARAQEQPPTEVSAAETKLQQAREQLQTIQQSLVEKRKQLDQLRSQLAKLTDAVERDELQKRISQEETDMSTLRRSFENIALGGVDSSVFDPAKQNLEFNWQQELKLILEPLFQKMKELTDKPRQIEQLKSRIVILEGKQRVVSRALENLGLLRTDELDAATRRWLDVIHQAWTQQYNDILREQDIIRLRLNVMLDDDDTFLSRIHQSITDFIGGSGRNLALSLAAFISTLLLMKAVFYLYNRISGSGIRMSIGRRVLTYGYHALTLVLSILAALVVLYLLGDMMLLVIAVILLVLMLVGLRNKIPFIIEETRMLLDLGPVREHERVIYRDLPWMVRSLGVYSHFNNPALEGVLRLPMTDVMALVSRPVREDEPWFPTRVGDWVMFADGSMGQVLRQTPDMVQLRSRGSILTWNTAAFYRENLRNLSYGFSLSITFGIDYKHQAISTTDVPVILKQAVEQALKQSDSGKHIENVLVEFQDAGASALNYLINVSVNGAAADSYYAIGRLLQRACVDCCNSNNWVIPFNQMTINAGEGFGVVAR